MSNSSDYMSRKPGTPYGDLAIANDKHYRFRPQAPPLKPAIPPAPSGRQSPTPQAPPVVVARPPRKPYEPTKPELALGVIVWLTFWLALYQRMGGLTSFSFGMIAGGAVMRFWKVVIVIAIAAGAVWYAAQPH